MANGKSTQHQSTFFPSQIREGNRILKAFDDGALICSFVAPVQWGKTGVLLYVTSQMVKNGTVAGYSHVFILTGMADNEWRKQTRERAPPEMRDNILHRRNMMKVAKTRSTIRDALFIVDECHIGSLSGSTLSRFFTEIGIYGGADVMRERNLRILQISATPEVSLLNAQYLPDGIHKLIKSTPGKTYTGIGDIFKSERFHDYNAVRREQAYTDALGAISNEFNKPRYHLIRVNGRLAHIRKVIIQIAKKQGFAVRIHDNTVRKDRRITDAELRTEPERHTIILVKNMWKAAKTIPHEYLGVVVSGLSFSSAVEAQGLIGRICGHNKKHNIQVYGNYDALSWYQHLMDDPDNLYNEDIQYQSANLVIKGGAYRKIAKSYLCPHLFDGMKDVVLPTIVPSKRAKAKHLVLEEGVDYTLDRSIHEANPGEDLTQLFKRVKTEMGAKYVRNPFTKGKNKDKDEEPKTVEYWLYQAPIPSRNRSQR
jgi:hypothetical protein